MPKGHSIQLLRMKLRNFSMASAKLQHFLKEKFMSSANDASTSKTRRTTKSQTIVTPAVIYEKGRALVSRLNNESGMYVSHSNLLATLMFLAIKHQDEINFAEIQDDETLRRALENAIAIGSIKK